MLSKEAYLDLVRLYLQHYTGKFIYDGGQWVELLSPEICWLDSLEGRRLDCMRDAYGNSWFVMEELDIMGQNLKLLDEDKLPNDAPIIRRRG